MAREALGIVGAAVGYAVSGPYGAYWGFVIGYGAGGYLFPEKIAGPGLSEAPVQTSRDGVPIPIIWGLHHCHGNVIQKNPETQTTTTTSQGKGGSTEVEETRRFRTFAIGVCRGPIAEITRIWENDKLVYDIREVPTIPVAETEAYAEGITIYLGTNDQLPDPELEAHWGVGTTPAYRCLAYVVWVDKDVTDFGGAIPQFRFEVNGSKDAIITSKPYPVEAVDGLQAVMSIGQPIHQFDYGELLETTITPEPGTLTTPLHTFTYEEEGLVSTITPEVGTLVVKLETFTWDEEGLVATIVPEDGENEVRLLDYTFEEEGLVATITPENGTLV